MHRHGVICFVLAPWTYLLYSYIVIWLTMVVLCGIAYLVDYMGSSVLMMRLSELGLTLHDEWHVEKEQGSHCDLPVATNRLVSSWLGG